MGQPVANGTNGTRSFESNPKQGKAYSKKTHWASNSFLFEIFLVSIGNVMIVGGRMDTGV